MTITFNIGECIAVTKFPKIKHYGIYMGNGTVIDASPKRGEVSEASLAEFEGQGKAYVVPRTSNFSPSEIATRAKERIGKPYKLFSQNCEHFVTDVLSGTPRSKQVAVAVGMVATFFLIRRLSKR